MAQPSKKGPETTIKIFCAGCKQFLYKYRKVINRNRPKDPRLICKY